MTPSARILSTTQTVSTVTDGQGRDIELRRITALDKLRLFKAVGPTLAQNERYLGMAVLAFAVVAIDGVPVPAPTNEAQIESLIVRLGDSGLAAIGEMIGAMQIGGTLDREVMAGAGN